MEIRNTITHFFSSGWQQMIGMFQHYVVSPGNSVKTFVEDLYEQFTLLNLVVFCLKVIPTSIYTYKLVKSIYISSRNKIKSKQMELAVLQLQIDLINSKLSSHESELKERMDKLRAATELLRRVRANLGKVIASGDLTRGTLDLATIVHCDLADLPTSGVAEDDDFLSQLVKEMKCDYKTLPPRQSDKMGRGEHLMNEQNSVEGSIYSSLSDSGDVKRDHSVKILRVTNLYKVAYLKYYIKQKRLRKANRQAVLKKRMESVKRLFDDWQKRLDMVANKSLKTHMSNDIDEHSKRGLSTDDSDLELTNNEFNYDECSQRCSDTSCKDLASEQDEIKTDVETEKQGFYDTPSYMEGGFINPPLDIIMSGPVRGRSNGALSDVPEEASEDAMCMKYEKEHEPFL